MKKLNDKKQFKRALDLFYECEQKNSEIISSLVISQALKSFTKMEDFQGGSYIHQRYSSLIEKNNYTIASLINFYS
jgi:hypothetical protein